MPDDFGEWDELMELDKLRRLRERAETWREAQVEREPKAALDVIISEEYD